ncbi:MAG TPA: NAD(P)/FAD-dependent oxidoreductase [Fimbriimonas sp.]|nr:NAD(P)/FAD-dependent oxidoreductase [Fimbriimonas sp.]
MSLLWESKGCGRTPLFRDVRRWMRLAMRENAAERPQGEISRREVLAGAGAVALALSPVGSVLKKFPGASPKVVIVGAGVAGLTAAWYLKKGGISADIYEASCRVGGRIWTVANQFGLGTTTELGGEFIDSGHKTMLHLAKAFNLDTIDLESPSEAGLRETYFFGGRERTESEIVTAFQPLAAKIAADANKVKFKDYLHFNKRAETIDNTPLDEYFKQIGATGWLNDLLTVAYVTEYGLDAGQQSALNFVFLVGTDTSDGFKEFGESDQRFKIKGGNQRVTDALAATLDEEIHVENELTALADANGGYRLSFKRANGSVHDVSADYIILALPFSTLRQVDITAALPDVKRKAINDIAYGQNIKVIIGFERAFWRDAGQNGLFFTDQPAQSGWDSTQLQNGAHGSITVYGGGSEGLLMANGSEQSQVTRLMPGLNKIFPGAKNNVNSNVLRFVWPNYRWTQGSYTCFTPGQYTHYGGATQETVGKMYFAGEHCSIDAQGYMEGGALTGKQAANALLASL